MSSRAIPVPVSEVPRESAARPKDPLRLEALPRRRRVTGQFSAALERPAIKTYCSSGIAATIDAFVLHRLGHGRVSVYDGSLSEWSRDPTLAMET